MRYDITANLAHMYHVGSRGKFWGQTHCWNMGWGRKIFDSCDLQSNTQPQCNTSYMYTVPL